MRPQAGMILLFCLVLLALISLMAVAGLESIVLHERTEANMRLSRDGFAAAEAALAEAETGLGGQCPDVGAGFSSTLPQADSNWRQSAEFNPAWWRSHGHQATFPGVTQQPRFVVESWREMAIQPDPSPPLLTPLSIPVYYRVTARGEGAGATMLQTVGVIVCEGGIAVSQTRLSWRQLF